MASGTSRTRSSRRPRRVADAGTPTETVGFVGLGVMGAPMARHLLDAGMALVVHNRSSGPAEALRELGASVAATPRELTSRSRVVIAMLPDSADVSAVVEGSDGLLAGAAEGSLIIDMSTISPIVTRRLAALAADRGVAMLDAPVSGGDVGAREASLSIMVGGDGDAFERALPILQVLGRTIVHVGAAGAG